MNNEINKIDKPLQAYKDKNQNNLFIEQSIQTYLT